MVEGETFLQRLAQIVLEFRLGGPEPAWDAFRQARDILSVGGPNGWYLLGEIVQQAEGEDGLRWASELALEHWAADQENVERYRAQLSTKLRDDQKFRRVAELCSGLPLSVQRLLDEVTS